MIIRLIIAVLAGLSLQTAVLGADLGDLGGQGELGGLREAPKYSMRSAYPSQRTGFYPLSWRAAKIRRADRCWRGCLVEAGREFQTCLRHHWTTDCVASNDAADRFCLRECRLSGGPWLSLGD